MISDQYAAGFFDGEGCVYLGNRKARPTPSLLVCISNTHLGILEELRRTYGGSICMRPNPKPRHRQQWQWMLSTKKSAPFLRAIAPFLIVKKEVVGLAIQFINVLERPHWARFTTEIFAGATRLLVRPKRTPEYISDISDLTAKIRTVNARGFNALRKAS